MAARVSPVLLLDAAASLYQASPIHSCRQSSFQAMASHVGHSSSAATSLEREPQGAGMTMEDPRIIRLIDSSEHNEAALPDLYIPDEEVDKTRARRVPDPRNITGLRPGEDDQRTDDVLYGRLEGRPLPRWTAEAPGRLIEAGRRRIHRGHLGLPSSEGVSKPV